MLRQCSRSASLGPDVNTRKISSLYTGTQSNSRPDSSDSLTISCSLALPVENCSLRDSTWRIAGITNASSSATSTIKFLIPPVAKQPIKKMRILELVNSVSQRLSKSRSRPSSALARSRHKRVMRLLEPSFCPITGSKNRRILFRAILSGRLECSGSLVTVSCASCSRLERIHGLG